MWVFSCDGLLSSTGVICLLWSVWVCSVLTALSGMKWDRRWLDRGHPFNIIGEVNSVENGRMLVALVLVLYRLCLTWGREEVFFFLIEACMSCRQNAKRTYLGTFQPSDMCWLFSLLKWNIVWITYCNIGHFMTNNTGQRLKQVLFSASTDCFSGICQ